MKKIKIRIAFCFVLLFIYFILSSLYIKLNVNTVKLYILNKDKLSGQLITKDDLSKIKVDKNINKLDILKIDDDTRIVAKNDLQEGQILSDKLVSKEDEYIYKDSNEIISIDLDEKDIAINKRLEKNKIVNLYYYDNNKSVSLLQENVKILKALNFKGEEVENNDVTQKI